MRPDPSLPIGRRRVLTLLAVGAGLAALGPGFEADEEWRGAALGAEARLLFAGAGRPERARAVAETLAEIERLEAAFSLQQDTSELARLNAEGRLAAASPDFLSLLSLCGRLHGLTAGLFDPTVQPLWRGFLAWYAGGAEQAPPPALVAELRRHVGFGKVAVTGGAVTLAPGTALTLNGIAQGYITDRVAERLGRLGFRHVLVEIGETRVLDGRGDGSPFRVAVPGRDRPLRLLTGAVATSAGAATPLGRAGDHHLFDPRSGRPARRWASLSVHHRSAAVADGLSTGLFAAAPSEIARILALAGGTAWALAPGAPAGQRFGAEA